MSDNGININARSREAHLFAFGRIVVFALLALSTLAGAVWIITNQKWVNEEVLGYKPINYEEAQASLDTSYSRLPSLEEARKKSEQRRDAFQLALTDLGFQTSGPGDFNAIFKDVVARFERAVSSRDEARARVAYAITARIALRDDLDGIKDGKDRYQIAVSITAGYREPTASSLRYSTLLQLYQIRAELEWAALSDRTRRLSARPPGDSTLFSMTLPLKEEFLDADGKKSVRAGAAERISADEFEYTKISAKLFADLAAFPPERRASFILPLHNYLARGLADAERAHGSEDKAIKEVRASIKQTLERNSSDQYLYASVLVQRVLFALLIVGAVAFFLRAIASEVRLVQNMSTSRVIYEYLADSNISPEKKMSEFRETLKALGTSGENERRSRSRKSEKPSKDSTLLDRLDLDALEKLLGKIDDEKVIKMLEKRIKAIS